MRHKLFIDESIHSVTEDLAGSHDREWIRSLASSLERSIPSDPLNKLRARWSLTTTEAGTLFGVTRPGFSKWQVTGVPAEKRPILAALNEVTDILEQDIERERIPAIVRMRYESIGNYSLVELAQQGRYVEMIEAAKVVAASRGRS